MSAYDTGEIIEAVGEYGCRVGLAAASFVIDEDATYETAAQLLDGITSGASPLTYSPPTFGEWPGAELILEAYLEAQVEEDDDAANDFDTTYMTSYAVALEDAVAQTARRIVLTKLVHEHFGEDANPDDYMHLLDEDEDTTEQD